VRSKKSVQDSFHEKISKLSDQIKEMSMKTQKSKKSRQDPNPFLSSSNDEHKNNMGRLLLAQ
jgi:hypothetical protein